jgi:hypothetical protein
LKEKKLYTNSLHDIDTKIQNKVLAKQIWYILREVKLEEEKKRTSGISLV